MLWGCTNWCSTRPAIRSTFAMTRSRGEDFAEGAVRGAEWLADKKGFFDFKDVWRKLRG